MNLSKHVNVTYKSDKNLMKAVVSPMFVRYEPVVVEDGVNIYEVVKKKKKIRDSIPVATAFFILNYAKLHVLKVSCIFKVSFSNNLRFSLYRTQRCT